jgi:hypothetical protein
LNIAKFDPLFFNFRVQISVLNNIGFNLNNRRNLVRSCLVVNGQDMNGGVAERLCVRLQNSM